MMKYIFFISILFSNRISQNNLWLVAFARVPWKTTNEMFVFNRGQYRFSKVLGEKRKYYVARILFCDVLMPPSNDEFPIKIHEIITFNIYQESLNISLTTV